MANSVYIHIPFCKQKCKYCSFVSFAKIEKQFEYIDSLIKEIDFYYKNEGIKTLYFGGGTPSLLDIELLKKVFNKFKLNPKYEATIEINPDDANEEYFKKLKNIGFNRISIGLQDQTAPLHPPVQLPCETTSPHLGQDGQKNRRCDHCSLCYACRNRR